TAVADKRIRNIWGMTQRVFGSLTRSLEGAGHFCTNPTRILCGGSQLELKIFHLNTEDLLNIVGVQKLLHQVSVRCNLTLNICLERAYLLLIGARKTSHCRLDHIKIALRSTSHLFEIIKHHSSNGFERILGFHGMLLASHVVYPGMDCLSNGRPVLLIWIN